MRIRLYRVSDRLHEGRTVAVPGHQIGITADYDTAPDVEALAAGSGRASRSWWAAARDSASP
ncbi:hypothetical protein [Mycobacterium sp. 1081908.1]|uniref:hypothetical protein n=1 Tax=Mycobacterium sp. 1081908.1 TaxID=1834066 RepID=UPI0008005EC8|nr:hypothetical protein [Mycobacterium sp. 1081908.1]OBK44608.1 hypothetical protein A5655_13975 [Mycobacterium sp. 1081908.1]